MVPEKLAKEERDAAIYLATWDLRYGTLCKDDFNAYFFERHFVFSATKLTGCLAF
jgi:hypothetical protein